MFIRFVQPWRDEGSRAEAGFFRSAGWVLYNEEVDLWLREELWRELEWFEENLPKPERIVMVFKRRRPVHGICWFRPEADEAIDRARYIGWLMTEAGVPVAEIRTRDPGQLIWEDPMQIVAKPGGHVPVAFH